MEAAKLQKKKTTISKGKLKKTMKNIICRPDPVFWPVVSDEYEKQLEQAISKYKVNIPVFQKPHWSELKSVPKEKRPKPPAIEKVDGFLFGITTCYKAIRSKNCSAVILDGEINPKFLVQHILEACSESQVPVVCLNGLKKISNSYFGVSTCCLGFDKDNTSITDVINKVEDIAKSYQKLQTRKNYEVKDEPIDIYILNSSDEKTKETSFSISYLYRKTKTCRAFIPSSAKPTETLSKDFIGQDFIVLPSKSKAEDKHTNKKKNSKKFMNMIVKRISNNANRIKKS